MQETAQADEPVSEIGEPAAAARALPLDDSLLPVGKDEDYRLALAQGAKQRLTGV
jgi:hypothetical protein